MDVVDKSRQRVPGAGLTIHSGGPIADTSYRSKDVVRRHRRQGASGRGSRQHRPYWRRRRRRRYRHDFPGQVTVNGRGTTRVARQCRERMNRNGAQPRSSVLRRAP